MNAMKIRLWVAIFCIMSVALTACTGRSPNSEGGGERELDWDNLIANAVAEGSRGEAASKMSFQPRFPDLGGNVEIVVSNPQTTPPQLRNLGLHYDHPDYGMFWIIERITEGSQAELESIAGCSRGQGGCDANFRLIALNNGIRALLIEGGDVATSVTWLVGRVEFRVLGPVDTLSADEATAIANTVMK